MALTKRQFEVFSFLETFLREKSYCPSFDEIGKHLGLSSLATVHKHINTLERKGFIRRDYNRSRSIEILKKLPQKPRADTRRIGISKELQLPLLGRIAAGTPLEAVSSRETLSLQEFVGSKSVYVLEVKGQSMIEDHICDGDFVVIEKTETAEDGETVVALLDGTEATLKRIYHEKDGSIRLQPANSAMQPILIKAADLRIQGRVIAVLRKY